MVVEEEEEEHFKLLLKGKGDVLPLGGDLRHDAKQHVSTKYFKYGYSISTPRRKIILN